MDRKHRWLPVVICLVLFLLGCLLSDIFSQHSPSQWTAAGNAVQFSEVLASNRTYPSPEGELLDYIELHNTSENAVDISGYMLSDDLESIGYTFPEQTILPPGGYLACWCLPDDESGRYASFGISRSGGETIYLYNTSNVCVDSLELPVSPVNTALIPGADGLWIPADRATPGFANTPEGYDQYVVSMQGDAVHVSITEIMTDNSCITTASGPSPCDYLELTNTGSQAVNLTGAYLSNDPADPLKWQLPELILPPEGSAVVFCGGEAGQAPFGLSRSGCTVTLTGILGDTLAQVTCPALETDHVWALQSDGEYQITVLATPGFPNTQEGYEAWVTSVGGKALPVVISEVMTANRSTLLSAGGQLCDWVELTNTGSESVDLTGAYLSDDPAQRGKWQIPALVLAPGQSAVISCVGADAAAGEADFALSRSGCTLILSGSCGNILTQLECPELEADRVWALQADGSYCQSSAPSPGYPNDAAGCLAYRATQTPAGPLAISEAMVSNDRFLVQSDGRYYDWVELENISDAPVLLSDYCLSNDPDELARFPLPERTLAPGERIVIICSAKEELVGKYPQAPFSLSARECWLYVTHTSGSFSDYLRLAEVPSGYSIGRNSDLAGSVYFAQPTPGRPNGEGLAAISQMPEFETAAGIYNDVSSLSVALTGPGQVHYTTDGSAPTQEDPVYTGPISLTGTTVLRAVSFEAGKLPSNVATAAYILNENHTLPVVSLSADPDALLGEEGLFAQTPPQDAEIACQLAFFEGDSGFSIDGGVELMGTDPAYPGKHSLQVNFRGGYGASVLSYPLFGADGPQVFDALCLTASSEHAMTLFREELMLDLALDFTDSVPVQHYRFCVLYINGAYYGIYSLRDDIGTMLYSQYMEVAQADTEMVEEPALFGSDLYALAQACDQADYSTADGLSLLSGQVDTDSLIDWTILQGYAGLESPGNNLRYFRSPEAGSKWQLGFFGGKNSFTARSGFTAALSQQGPGQYLRMTRAIGENPELRQQFLERLCLALQEELSSTRVLERIDGLSALLAPEIARERQRWGGSEAVWQADVDRLRSYWTRYDHRGLLVQTLREQIGLTDGESSGYFGR